MSAPIDEFLALLEELTAADVDYVVIGALAVNYHGVVRGTEDVDIVPGPESGNLGRLRTALRALDAHVPGGDPRFDPLGQQALEMGASIECLTRLGPLHIVQGQAGTPSYEALRRDSHPVALEGVRFRICSYGHLIAMKEAAGRAQDEADLADLRRARELAEGE